MALELHNLYRREEISRHLGGQLRHFMPTKHGRVTCVCIDLKKNPRWPEKLLLIITPKYLRNAQKFAAAKEFVPCFVRHRSAEWEYVGEYRASGSTEAPEELAAFGRGVKLAVFLENRAEVGFEPEAESFDAQERAEGFQSNPEIRRIVEKYAMDKAKEKLSGLGFSNFKDTSGQECYDYTCERGGNLYYVEVKGTQGPGASLILTKNEVEHGQKHQQRSIAVVVHDVKVGAEGGSSHASGGTSRVCLPWIVESAALEPIQYKWTVSACPALPAT